MAFQLRRGTDDQRSRIRFAAGEIVYAVDTKKLYVGDGTTLGGTEVSISPDTVSRLEALAGSALDSATVVQITNDTIDSAGVSVAQIQTLITDTVDGSYVQARQTRNATAFDGQPPAYYLNFNNLSNQPAIQDSTQVQAIIDATDTFDSAAIQQMIDITINRTDLHDSDLVQGQIDTTLAGGVTVGGGLTVEGNLMVQGDTTTVSSTTVAIGDKNIVLADSASNAAEANNAGLTINGANATILYKSSGDKWEFNKAPYYGAERLLTTADNPNADTLDNQDGTYYLDYNNFTNTPNILDSGHVSEIAIYEIGVNAFDSTAAIEIAVEQIANTDTHDSAAVQGQITSTITSSYIQSRQTTYDFSTDTEPFIDAAYIETRRPAEALLSVENDSAGYYKFVGDGFPTQTSGSPTLYLHRGMEYKFTISAVGHPFYIKTEDVGGTGSQYTSGVTNNGTQLGTLTFEVPMNAPEKLYYVCQYHSGMTGEIIIDRNVGLDSAAIISLTTTDTHDSAAVQGQIDSNLNLLDTHDSALVSAQITSTVDSAYVEGKIKQTFIDTFDTHDSTAVSAQITSTVDAAYVQARQTTYDFLDSAEALALIDSSHVRGKIDQTFIDTFDTHDSAAVQGQIDTRVTQSFVNNLNVDADTLDGQEGTYYLNYNNFSNTPNVLDSSNVTSIINATDTHDSTAVQGQIDATVNALDTHDSAAVQGQIDSSVTQASVRAFIDQAFIDTFDTHDSSAVSGQITATVNQSFIDGFDTHDSAAVVGQINATVTQSFINAFDTHDSTAVSGQITDTVTQSFIDGFDTHDSALVQGQIDSSVTQASVRAFIDQAFIDTFDTHDSSAVSGQISSEVKTTVDSAYLRSAFSGGTGVTYNNGTGAFAIGQSVGTTDSVTFATLSVVDLTVTGTQTVTNTSSLSVTDPFIQLAEGNDSNDLVDIGFVGHYYDGSTIRYTGMVRDASTGGYALFVNLDDSTLGGDSSIRPSAINVNGPGYTLANLAVGTVTGNLTGDVTGDVTGTVSSISNHNTGALSEGSNLYYTTARANSAIDGRVTATFVNNLSVDYTSLSNLPFILDSNNVQSIVDATDLHDSAAVQGQIDATIAATDTHDSAAVVGQINLEVDADFVEAIRPAETIFDLSSSGSPNYVFSGDGFPSNVNNPVLHLTRGKTYKFANISGSHPLEIRSSAGGSAYSDGVTNNGGSGSVIFTVPMDAPNKLYYQCTVHSSMLGTIYIDEIVSFDSDISMTGDLSVTGNITVNGNDVLTTASDTHDSAAVLGQINATVNQAYIDALDTHDSAAVLGQITSTVDAAYVQARQLTFDFLDSTEALNLIDQTYVRNQIDQSFIDTFDTHDSALVLAQINARVDQSFINTFDTHDSALVVAQINATVDQTFINAFDTHDSGLVVAQINATVDSTFINNLNVDASTLGGQAGSYYLNYNNFTNTPNVLDSADVTLIVGSATHDSAKVQGQIDSSTAGFLTEEEITALVIALG